jgi:hypothetical protein
LFERYTEKARRVIFFARYEASQFGGEYIEPDHLFLGLMREDIQLRAIIRGTGTSDEKVRQEVESLMAQKEKTPTSAEMPLNEDATRVLTLAAEEADSLSDESIDMRHLVLGVLRVPCICTSILEKHGITHATYRDAVGRPVVKPAPVPPEGPKGPLSGQIASLNRLLDLEVAPLDPNQPLKRKPWTRQQALGRLVDLATTHHQWFARALAEPVLTTAGYPPEVWVVAQDYANYYSWRELVSLWLLINRLLLHQLTLIPEAKLNMQCRMGVAETIPLSILIERYVSECEDLLGQMMAKLD